MVNLSELPPLTDWNGESLTGDHEARMTTADVSYPIFITAGDDHYDIVDGCHRYYRAKRAGKTAIRAIVLSESDLGECLF